MREKPSFTASQTKQRQERTITRKNTDKEKTVSQQASGRKPKPWKKNIETLNYVNRNKIQLFNTVTASGCDV